MTPFFKELCERFPEQIRSVEEPVPGQVTILLSGSDVTGLARHFIAEYQARLVTVFAEDRVNAEDVFYNYYVFDRLGDPSWVILKAPIPSDRSSFQSLAAELPAVNWQEREIQDWFGLEAAGHPNPRRVALHDNWPDVHPLRKDFPLHTVLPPFEGERHIYRPTYGEGVFQIPVGPVHAGIIEPGHFNFAVAGEPVLYLQLRMFYTHKGTEKLFENLPIPRAGKSRFRHGRNSCASSCSNWNESQITSPMPAPSPTT
jgi:Ni,Fe-hydrogenase III component G